MDSNKYRSKNTVFIYSHLTLKDSVLRVKGKMHLCIIEFFVEADTFQLVMFLEVRSRIDQRRYLHDSG